MSVEFDTSLPSIRILQGFVREKASVELRLNDSSIVAGTMLWLDPIFYCVADASGKQILIDRRSVATISPQ